MCLSHHVVYLGMHKTPKVELSSDFHQIFTLSYQLLEGSLLLYVVAHELLTCVKMLKHDIPLLPFSYTYCNTSLTLLIKTVYGMLYVCDQCFLKKKKTKWNWKGHCWCILIYSNSKPSSHPPDVCSWDLKYLKDSWWRNLWNKTTVCDLLLWLSALNSSHCKSPASFSSCSWVTGCPISWILLPLIPDLPAFRVIASWFDGPMFLNQMMSLGSIW